MDAKDYAVISVLGDQRRFVVPIYQRQYSWGEERLLPFWEDVVAKADEALERKPKFNHYMGALILAPGGDAFTIGATPQVQVVDGQQRLTTFQLFLAALRDVALQREMPGLGPVIHNYLYVSPMHGDTATDARFRLIPTPEDRAIFHLIIESGLKGVRLKYPEWFFRNGRLIKKQAPNAVRAMALFVELIDRYARYGLVKDSDIDDEFDFILEESTEACHSRLQALLEAVLNHLKLVVITLSENDDAQVIFETLNSKAEPLLAMDLVRNNIFHRAAAHGESVEALFEAKWRPFDNDRMFWKADSPRAKPKRPRIDHFLSHVLTAQTGDEISLRELYAEYRAFTRPKGKPRFDTVEAELDALLQYAPVYRTLETGQGDASLAAIGRKMNLWEISTVYPLIFSIATADVPAETKEQFYTLIYSYLVRRAVCGLTPKNLNKTFARIVSVMLKEGVSLENFAAAFADQRGDAVRFPDDTEFRAAIRHKPVYLLIQRKERLNDLLWDLECALRTKYNVNAPRPGNMSVEHILPQDWTAHWPLLDGRMSPPDKATGADEDMLSRIRIREGALHTLGNLTLITVPGNTVASNDRFERKKPWLKKSLLALNLAIDECEAWNEDAISKRADILADLAVNLWPTPLTYVDSLSQVKPLEMAIS